MVRSSSVPSPGISRPPPFYHPRGRLALLSAGKPWAGVASPVKVAWAHELGRRKRVGETETGVVYQCRVRLGESADAPVCRCIVVELHEPTRDGDAQPVLLTNVPARRAKAK